MTPEDFISLVAKSFNPSEYHNLISMKKRDTIIYILYLLFVSIIVGFILNLPYLLTSPTFIDREFSKFKRFDITGIDIETSEPVVLVEHPKTVLDFSENRTEIGDATILITKTEVMWKKPIPDIFKLRLFTIGRKPLSEFSNILEQVSRLRSIYWMAFLLMLPSLFLIAYLFNIAKYSVIIILAAILGYFVLRILGKKIGFYKIIKAAAYSSTVLVLLDTVLGRLLGLGVFSLIIYLVMFFVCLFMLPRKDFRHKEKE